MEKCVIYSRVSTTHQNYESQISQLEEYAKRRSIKVVKIFAEKVSGYKQEVIREEYDLMKEFVIKNSIDLILIWEISRFSRRMSTLVSEINYFAENGVNIYSLQGGYNTLIDGKLNYMLVGIMGAMVQMERDNIKERITRGVREAALKGKRAGIGVLPYGYTVDSKGYLVIDKKEAKIIKLIFDLYDKRVSQRKVAIHLNSISVPTRWQKNDKLTNSSKKISGFSSKRKHEWQPNTVSGIIRNPIYKGFRRFRDEVVPAPPIISEEQWDRVQIIADSKVGTHTKKGKYNYLLRGKLFCGMCGATFNTVSRKRKGIELNYVCNSKSRITERCKCGTIRSERFDERIYSLMLSQREFLEAMKEERMEKFNPKEKEGQIIYYKGEISDLEKKSKRMIKLYKDGFIGDKEFESEMKSIQILKNENEFEIKQITEDLKQFKNKEKQTISKEEFMEKWETTKFNVRRELIERYLQRIVVSNIEKFDFKEEDIDESHMAPWRKEQLKKYIVKKPPFNQHYVEMFAYGSDKPIKMIFYSFKDESYFTDKFKFKEGVLRIENL